MKRQLQKASGVVTTSDEFSVPFHWLNFYKREHFINKASGHFQQIQINKISLSIKQPVTEQELYQITIVSASDTRLCMGEQFEYHKMNALLEYFNLLCI